MKFKNSNICFSIIKKVRDNILIIKGLGKVKAWKILEFFSRVSSLALNLIYNKIISYFNNINLICQISFWIIFSVINIIFVLQYFLCLTGIFGKIQDFLNDYIIWNFLNFFGIIIIIICIILLCIYLFIFFKEKYYFYNLQILYLYFFKNIYIKYFNNISNVKDKYNFFL